MEQRTELKKAMQEMMRRQVFLASQLDANQKEMLAKMEAKQEKMMAKLDVSHNRVMDRKDSELETMEACLGEIQATYLEASPGGSP
jgi:hypothetical protein